ncbi:YlzJ-like family protein [Microaerobacter geothermalis]|uniref:YlzJ-like family protein n=1 Tax=Microaerobacter geothermalis TaxID=674972 RepID=UPI001F24282D|nr:YlzJ-like family protein [Microaerobacter geothermalis]MCF6093170.1 YlzJ-like family protein [Microaerobacter geothermalis]
MIIYSTIPLETIFEGWDQFHPQYAEVQMGEITMVVEKANNFEAKIVRLISPNPCDYLNPKWAPGEKIYFRPET